MILMTQIICLWNVDEHGTEDVLKCNKVVGIKCVKTFQTVSREKSRRSTMFDLCQCSWVLHYTQLLSIGANIMIGGRTNAQKSHGALFKEGLHKQTCLLSMEKYFLYHLYAAGQLDKPNLIVMDSHYAHTFNYVYMKMMYEKGHKGHGFETTYITSASTPG